MTRRPGLYSAVNKRGRDAVRVDCKASSRETSLWETIMTGRIGAVQAVFDKEKQCSGAGFVLYDDKPMTQAERTAL